MRRSMVMVVAVTLSMVASTIPALAGSDTGLNARFMRWVDRSDVIHLFEFEDEGRPGQAPAVVDEGSPILFGYEWGGPDSPEGIQAEVLDNPAHTVELSIDGGAFFSVKDGYQTPFVAVPGEGPRWSWDHDGDGLGDGNGNGIGDWNVPLVFWRYEVKHMAAGTHTFEFRLVNGDVTFTDTITAVFGG